MQQVGKYQLIRKLATGGMAEVFLAKAAGPMGFEKTLVLKRILPHLAEEPAFVEMFLSEAKLAAQLTHPNVVQIFDFGEADGAYFLAMEYIDGPNLRTLVKRAAAQGVELPMAACARIVAHGCEGLAFAHDFADPETGAPLGLIHRDISPDNILLSRQGAVKVVDFGIAKAAGQGHKTASGVIKGKLAYMPPEQVRAEELDRRVDVYSLGVVLYELLTAHKPFESESDVGLMRAILTQSPMPAVQFRPDLPDSLRRILGRALSKDREHRYPDCHAFQSDLEEFILSVGKPVTTQQIAQLITQVTASADRTPPGSQPLPPRHSGETPSVTPVHTPPPPEARTDVESSTAQGTVKMRKPEAVVERGPEAPVESQTIPDLRARARAAPPEAEARPEIPTVTAVVPRPRPASPSSGAPKQDDWTPVLPPRRGRWILPLACVLLVAGGGYLLWPASSPEPHPAEPVREAGAVPPSEGQPSAPPDSSRGPAPSPAPSEGSAGVQPQDTDGGVAAAEPRGDDGGVAAATPQGDDGGVAAATPQGTPAAPGSSSSAGPQPVVETKPPKRTPRVSPKPAAASSRKGSLEVRVRPFATVFLSGKDLGETPIEPMELPAGIYTVKLVNKSLSKTVVRSVEVKAGQPTVLRVNLLEE